jgi:hypothetical protein
MFGVVVPVTMKTEKEIDFIRNVLQRNSLFRRQINGNLDAAISAFTFEEYNTNDQIPLQNSFFVLVEGHCSVLQDGQTLKFGPEDTLGDDGLSLLNRLHHDKICLQTAIASTKLFVWKLDLEIYSTIVNNNSIEQQKNPNSDHHINTSHDCKGGSVAVTAKLNAYPWVLLKILPDYNDIIARYGNHRNHNTTATVNVDLVVQTAKASLQVVDDTLMAHTSSMHTVDWIQGKILASTGHREVCECLLDNGTQKAVKIYHCPNVQDGTIQQIYTLNNEIILLSQITTHKNIVQYYGSRWNEGFVRIEIFMELISDGTSISTLYTRSELSLNEIQHFTHEILLGTQHLHSVSVVHGNIKGANVIVGNDGSVKLSDYGISKSINSICSSVAIKEIPFWMAPEVLKDDSNYSSQSDVWSVGCTVVEMFTGKPPWPNDTLSNSTSFVFQMGEGKITPLISSLPPDAVNFVRSCLVRNPEERPPCLELLKLPFCA